MCILGSSARWAMLSCMAGLQPTYGVVRQLGTLSGFFQGFFLGVFFRTTRGMAVLMPTPSMLAAMRALVFGGISWYDALLYHVSSSQVISGTCTLLISPLPDRPVCHSHPTLAGFVPFDAVLGSTLLWLHLHYICFGVSQSLGCGPCALSLWFFRPADTLMSGYAVFLRFFAGHTSVLQLG